MRKYRAPVSSDWHLDNLPAGVSRFDDVAAAANAIADYAVQINTHECRTVFVFAGDLCNPDTPRCWKSVRVATRIATKLAEGCVPSVWLTGNHDVMEDGEGSHSLMPVDVGHPAVHVVAEPCYLHVLPGLPLLCLPYVSRNNNYTPDLFLERTIPYEKSNPKLIVGHLMIEGIAVGSETRDMPRGRDGFLPIDTLHRMCPAAKMVNGHYHDGQIYRGVHIPGALARFTVGEAQNTPRFLEFFFYGDV